MKPSHTATSSRAADTRNVNIYEIQTCIRASAMIPNSFCITAAENTHTHTQTPHAQSGALSKMSAPSLFAGCSSTLLTFQKWNSSRHKHLFEMQRRIKRHIRSKAAQWETFLTHSAQRVNQWPWEIQVADLYIFLRSLPMVFCHHKFCTATQIPLWGISKVTGCKMGLRFSWSFWQRTKRDETESTEADLHLVSANVNLKCKCSTRVFCPHLTRPMGKVTTCRSKSVWKRAVNGGTNTLSGKHTLVVYLFSFLNFLSKVYRNFLKEAVNHFAFLPAVVQYTEEQQHHQKFP